MKAMQEIQPKMKKIQEKYKNNPQMLQQKTGELFRNAGVNPLAGCLPLLVQMPILMGMYYALFNFTFPSAAAAAFFWLPNMSEPDPLYILPVLSALTTFLQQKMTSTEMNAQMKIMMTIMPLLSADQPQVPVRPCALLGDDERRADHPAVVDVPQRGTRGKGGDLNGGDH